MTLEAGVYRSYMPTHAPVHQAVVILMDGMKYREQEVVRQSCAFRDHFAELRRLGVNRLFGLSTQAAEYQREAADRLHLPFPLLSDKSLSLANALNLPTFEAGGLTLLKRLTMIIEDGRIQHIFYPVHSPDKNADAVIAWLKANCRS